MCFSVINATFREKKGNLKLNSFSKQLKRASACGKSLMINICTFKERRIEKEKKTPICER
jgi:hypothetical protein